MSAATASNTDMLTIIEGEGKFEMFAQLMDIGRVPGRLRKPFVVSAQHPSLIGKSSRVVIELAINGIAAQSGSGDCWFISGYVTAATHLTVGDMFSNRDNTFHGHYDTRHRTGWIKPGRSQQ